MVKGRTLVAALLVAVASAGGVARAATDLSPIPTTVSGVTRDELGRGVAGVEILVLAGVTAGNAVERAVTDEHGRFVLAAIEPGVYRIAAIKPGYLAALGRVNTLVKASLDLVLRPVPRDGEAGAEKVAPDLSWTLRLPPRSVLHELGAESSLDDDAATGGARAFAERLHDRLTGEVDHLVALGSWRAGPSADSSPLEGGETHMRLAGSLGDRGAISVQGRRGNLDAGSTVAAPSISRDAADVGVDVSYDAGDDERIAMSAYYARGDFEVGEGGGFPKGGARHGQRSWGYDARWRKQVDPSSQVAVLVGFQDTSLANDGFGAPVGVLGPAHDASNRAIAAEGSYEASTGSSHLLRVGVRAQRLDLSSPDVRVGRTSGVTVGDGTLGWSVLLDAEDRFTPAAPVIVSYGLAVRQGFDRPLATTVTPRLGASWSGRRLHVGGEVSYLASTNLSSLPSSNPSPAASPLGYRADLDAAIDDRTRWIASASYVPLLADRWSDPTVTQDGAYVSDGLASDRSMSFGLERNAPFATVSVRLTRGRAEGALAPAIDQGLPFLVLDERVIDYDAVRLFTKSPRSGSAFAIEYRALAESAVAGAASDVVAVSSLKTVSVDYAQDLVRFAGGRATCRLLLEVRRAFDAKDGDAVASDQLAEARRFAALQQRISAGVSLAF